MKTEKIIAIIALMAVGFAGVRMYRKSTTKPITTDYANASGIKKTQNCAVCRDSEGNNYHTGNDRNCAGRDTCVTRYTYESSIQ